MIQKRELKCYSEEKVCIYKYFKKKKKTTFFCSRFTPEEINQLGMLQKILKMSQRTLCLADVFKISIYQDMEIDILLFLHLQIIYY